MAPGTGLPVADARAMKLQHPDAFAVRAIDNRFDENLEYVALAYVDDAHILRCESGAELISCSGDKILEWWPLVPGAGMKMPDEQVDDADEVASRSSRRMQRCS